MSSNSTQSESPWGRWIIYIVATIVGAVITMYLGVGGTLSQAVVFGIGTGIAVWIADWIIENA